MCSAAAAAGWLSGVPAADPFNQPYVSTSLADFWRSLPARACANWSMTPFVGGPCRASDAVSGRQHGAAAWPCVPCSQPLAWATSCHGSISHTGSQASVPGVGCMASRQTTRASPPRAAAPINVVSAPDRCPAPSPRRLLANLLLPARPAADGRGLGPHTGPPSTPAASTLRCATMRARAWHHPPHGAPPALPCAAGQQSACPPDGTDVAHAAAGQHVWCRDSPTVAVSGGRRLGA